MNKSDFDSNKNEKELLNEIKWLIKGPQSSSLTVPDLYAFLNIINNRLINIEKKLNGR